MSRATVFTLPDKGYPIFKKQEIESFIESFGLSHHTINTRHWDWKRVLVYYENDGERGPILGRARFDRGIYYDMTWYHHVTDNKSSLKHLQYRWQFLLQTGRHASEELYNTALVEAEKVAQAFYEEAIAERERKVIWAKNNPRPNGKSRKVPKIPQKKSKFTYVLRCMESIDASVDNNS